MTKIQLTRWGWLTISFIIGVLIIAARVMAAAQLHSPDPSSGHFSRRNNG